MYENEKTISFSDMQEIELFVKAAEKCNFDIDVFYDHAVIDAKSLLGILAIGIQRQLKVCYGGLNANFEKVIAKLAVA